MALLSFGTTILSSQIHQSLQVEEYKLDNGLTVWMNVDHSQPKVFGAVVVKAGAKDSPDTGIAHYFEHMMFKGTDKIGTVDYEKEKILLDSIVTRYDELSKTKDKKIRQEIQAQINELSIEAAGYVIPNEFNRLISQYGGTGLNAGTSYDYTVYMNTFSPQYIAQWAELNSERLINPVFRLFQSELETVYEEKNMYYDFIGRDAIDKLLERYFLPHPYAYSILGNTENLKNPRLSEMERFFGEYYVGSNMGLILSGDFNPEEVYPIIEKTFSRIRSGEAPVKEKVEVPPFKGEENFTVKFPIPIVSVAGLGFRGVPANHPDQVPLNIVMGLLNNSNGTGYLDKLMVDRKLMAAMTVNENLNEAGFLAVIGIPKPVLQTRSKAKELLWHEINRVKAGDFTDEMFHSLKLEQKRKYVSRLEDINSRAEAMITLFSQGKDWNDYLKEIEHIDSLTRQDVISIANKYFTDNYLYVNKKTGKYSKDNLPKPNFKPIIPGHPEAVSAYAEELDKLPVRELEPRFIDLEEDALHVSLASHVNLYMTANPVNDIFTLDISYGIGKIEEPALVQLAAYLTFLGTERMSFDEFRGKLQALGSTMTCDVDESTFTVRVSGFDAHFAETLQLVSTFLKEVQPDDKKIKQLKDEEKLMKKAFFKSTDHLGHALLEKVRYGDQSIYLNKLSYSEVKKLKGRDLIDLFQRIQSVACDFYYCGTRDKQFVVEQLRHSVSLDKITRNSLAPYHRKPQEYNEPLVYVYHMPDAAQTILYGYVKGDKPESEEERVASALFSAYFGGDMSSLMFQEIREFRSLAYRTQGQFRFAPPSRGEIGGTFTTMLSTQADKTIDALDILHPLITDMPVKPERLIAAKQSLRNKAVNSYPVFRKMPEKVAAIRHDGFTNDPNKILWEHLYELEMEDVEYFYKKNVQGRPVVYLVIGNTRKIDMNRLAAYGKIVKVNKDDIYR